MKKVILSVVVIATTFLAMSFAPVEKNADLSKADLDFVTAEVAVAECTTKYETQTDFTKCDRTYEPPQEIEAQQNILNKY